MQIIIVLKFVKKLGCIFMLAWLLLNVSMVSAWAALPSTADMEEQNRRARRQAEERLQREQQQHILLQERKAEAGTPFPEETPAFLINEIILTGDSVDCFSWAQDLLNRYKGRKIGNQGINYLVKILTNAFIDRGYITTRIVVPVQDLQTGSLQLILIPGRIGDIRLTEDSARRNWRTAFPCRAGDILNLRDIEQGLEQMKRVPSQDVMIQIMPGRHPATSDIVLTVRETKHWNFTTFLDDSGIKATGKIQAAVTLSYDNIFNRNDICSISFERDGNRKSDLRGTDGHSTYYSVPAGNKTFTFTRYRHHFHQTVGNISPFQYSGESQNTEFRVSQLLHRNQNSKTHITYSLIKSSSKNYIEDTEIEVQRQNTSALQIALSQRLYYGQSILDLQIANRRGVPWFDAQDDPAERFPDAPTTRYNIWLFDASYRTPITMGRTKGRYSAVFHGQYTGDRLFGTEFVSIGGRFTVRGFDGEQTLSAESGWYLRNELEIPLRTAGFSVYTGVDCGVIYGPSSRNDAGRTLSGAVIGLRGGHKNVQYDLFAGWPLHKPPGFTTATPTYGFQLIYQV